MGLRPAVTASARRAASTVASSVAGAPPPPTPPLLLSNPSIHPSLVARAAAPRVRSRALVLGAVVYCEYIQSIWKGMMRHFGRQGLEVDFVLFTNYERQSEALRRGVIDVAWSGPLAHARLVRQTGGFLLPLGMRDSDRDFRSLVVVRVDSGIAAAAAAAERGGKAGLKALEGRRVAAGTVDSPQGYLMPLQALVAAGVDLSTLSLSRFDRDVGKHGDTAYGEDSVLDALVSGASEAGFLSSMMWERFVKAGRVPAGPDGQPLLRPLDLAKPIAFDHCQFDALPSLGQRAVAFQQALLAMDGSGHPEDRKTMELEGITRLWLPHRSGALPEDFARSAADRAELKKRAAEGAAGAAAGAAGAASATAPLPLDPRVGYEGMLAALEGFREPVVGYPGILHTQRRHPFKHLMVDTRVVLDAFGC
jgi:phosphonate transport system substrate-binding protein